MNNLSNLYIMIYTMKTIKMLREYKLTAFDFILSLVITYILCKYVCPTVNIYVLFIIVSFILKSILDKLESYKNI